MVESDLSVVCSPGKTDERGCRGAPDLVMEILSLSTQDGRYAAKDFGTVGENLKVNILEDCTIGLSQVLSE